MMDGGAAPSTRDCLADRSLMDVELFADASPGKDEPTIFVVASRSGSQEQPIRPSRWAARSDAERFVRRHPTALEGTAVRSW